MKNYLGKTVKPQYEVVLETWSHMNPIEVSKKYNDTESFDFVPCENYREAAKIAKELSNKIGEEFDGKPLVSVYIQCYFQDNTSSYNMVWYEYYVNGKKLFRDDN